MTKRILITGGASGLGKALAVRYLRDGYRVLITDVNTERGEATQRELSAQGEITFVAADTTSDADWQTLYTWVEKNWGGLDILVNNAGIAGAGRIETVTMDEWDRIIDINLKGVVRGCRTFVPMFKAQRAGHIVNIASLAAVANGPTMVSYNVTKSAVVSLSETLRFELAPFDVKTTVVCPSFFATNLGESLRTSEAALESTAKKLISGGNLNAEIIADKIAKGVKRGTFLVLPHLEGKALHLVKRYVPALFALGVRQASFRVHRMLEKKG